MYSGICYIGMVQLDEYLLCTHCLDTMLHVQTSFVFNTFSDLPVGFMEIP